MSDAPRKPKTKKKGARRRGGGETSKTAIETALKRKQALELRLQGVSYRRIGEAMEISHVRALQLVQEAIAEFGVREKTEEVVQMELDRLDEMMEGAYPAAARGDPSAVNAVLKIQERRAKLLGLDQPEKVNATITADDETKQVARDAGEFARRMSEMMERLSKSAQVAA